METITEARAVVMEGSGLDRVIRIITPGMGSSGYYPTETLKEAVKKGVFDEGLHLYVDHPTITEDQERPERSVRDLAAVGKGRAVWNESAQAVDQKIKIFPHYAWLGEVSGSIGMSIRCAAEVSEQTIEGKQTRVIDKLTEAYSVDFVTKAGRGGKILEAMESARPKINIGEALNEQRREALNEAARKLYGAPDRYVYVIDYDETATFAIIAIHERDDRGKLIKQSYSVGEDDLSVSFQDDAIEVKRVIDYRPVAKQATESQEGQQMPEITEAERKALDDKIAEAERRASDAERERDKLKAKEAERDRRTAAEARVAEKIGHTLDHLPAAVKSRVIEKALLVIPEKEGAVDLTALDRRVDEAITAEKEYLRAVTSGKITGHGATGATDDAAATEAAIKEIPFSGRKAG